YETVPAALIVYDRDMTIVDMNPAQARISRIDPDKVRGKSLYEVAPTTRERRETHERALAGEEIDAPDMFYEFTDGDSGYFAIRYRPVRDTDGAITGILSTATDVTERVRAEREGERQRARLEAILEGAPVGIAFYDREMRYMSLNREYAHITRRDREAMYGQSLYELFPQSLARKPMH